MRHLRVRTIFAAFCLVMLTAQAGAGQQRPRRRAALPDVQRIYVGDMGYEEEAERFRLMLEEQLQKRDFEVVIDPDRADAVLTGVLTMTHYEYNSDARVTVRVTSPSGDVLLTKDFGQGRFIANPLNLKEPLRRRAEEAAEALKREFRKPAKKGP